MGTNKLVHHVPMSSSSSVDVGPYSFSRALQNDDNTEELVLILRRDFSIEPFNGGRDERVGLRVVKVGNN